jgi:hypothetical protein
MRSRINAALGLSLTAAVLVPVASADEGYRHGRLSYAETGTTMQRATEAEAEEAIQNLPFLPGDRIWTDASGRAEFQFPEGTVVRLDRRSKLDYAGHEEESGERIVLRLWSGSVIVHGGARGQAPARFEIETPAGLVQPFERSVVRIDVDGGETRVSVYEGEGSFEGVRLALGERATAGWGERPGDPDRFDRFYADDFLEWDQERESAWRASADGARYLPEELGEYAGELEGHGDWRYETTVSSYVWVPQVEVGWRPYSSGRWAWTPYGWTWVPYEPWGWAPAHYGRWGFSGSFGWYWMPGRVWGPAWVSWAVGGGYVGWCPLGYRNHPVAPWGHWKHGYRPGYPGSGYRDRGYAVPRNRYGREVDAWNVVRQGEMGGRDLGRRRVEPRGLDPAIATVAASPLQRPTRNVAALRTADATPRAIRTRPTPGDYVRELAADNKTTIPAPWTRGYGQRPAPADGPRYGESASGGARARREPGAERSGSGARQAPQGSDVASSPRSAPRPAPWFTPPTGSRRDGTGEDGTVRSSPAAGAERRATRALPFWASPAAGGDEGQGARREDGRQRAPVTGGYRPQGDGAGRRSAAGSGAVASRPRGSQSGYRSQGDGGGSSSAGGGGYRPQGDGSGARAPRPAPSGGTEARRSGGGGVNRGNAGVSRGATGQGGGGHAVGRSRPSRE